MAGPIAHILVASIALQTGQLAVRYFAAVLRGTSWNDVRYLSDDVITREATHEKNVTWQTIKEDNDSFRVGMRIHALLDEVREHYMEQCGAYELVPKHPFSANILKFTEDRLLYERMMRNLQCSLADIFDCIDSDQRLYGMTEDSIALWHRLIWVYCEHKPFVEKAFMLLSAINKRRQADEPALELQVLMEDVVAKLEANEEYVRLVYEFYDNVIVYLEKGVSCKA